MKDKFFPKYIAAIRKAARLYIADLESPDAPLSILNASQAAFHQSLGPDDVLDLLDIAAAASALLDRDSLETDIRMDDLRKAVRR